MTSSVHSSTMAQDVVLSVQDDEANFFILAELFKDVCPNLLLEREKNGIEALALLRHLLINYGCFHAYHERLRGSGGPPIGQSFQSRSDSDIHRVAFG